MESHMSRFRVKLSSRRSPTRDSNAVNTSSSPKSRRLSTLPCSRCRRLKQDCSCLRAGEECSLQQNEEEELKERLAWMERLVNEGNLLAPGQSIDQVATGTELSAIAANKMRSGSLSHSNNLSPMEDASDAPALSTSSQSPADGTGASEIPPPKRIRLSGNTLPPILPPDERKPLRPHSQPHAQPAVSSPESSRSGASVSRGPQTSTRKFIDAYFQDVNRAYPFIDRERIMSTFKRLGDSVCYRPERNHDTMMLYLVMAVGFTTLQRTGKDLSHNGSSFEFKVNYREILHKCMADQSIDTIQILVLLSMYSLFDPENNTWPIIDILARQAMRMGLTRRSTAEEGYSAQQAERNRRLFWSIYTLDRMVSTSLGVLPAMVDSDMDVPMPGVSVDEFVSTQRLEYMDMLQVARHVAQLRMLEDEVQREVYLRDQDSVSRLSHTDRLAIVKRLRTKVEDWYSTGCLLKASEPDDLTIHIRISWLAARYYNLLLLLYYPSLFNPATNPLISKGELVSLAQKHVQANAVRFQQRHLPLQRNTLCRLFPVCMIFMQYAQPAPGEAASIAREEIGICADIMDAFPPAWTLAHRASAVVRQLASPLAGPLETNGREYIGPPSSRPSSWQVTDSQRAWRHAIRVNLLEIMKKVLGPGSAFVRLEYWNENLSGGPWRQPQPRNSVSGSEGQQAQDSLEPRTPGDLFRAGFGLGLSDGSSAKRSAVGNSIPTEVEAADAANANYEADVSALGFMDFL